MLPSDLFTPTPSGRRGNDRSRRTRSQLAGRESSGFADRCCGRLAGSCSEVHREASICTDERRSNPSEDEPWSASAGAGPNSTDERYPFVGRRPFDCFGRHGFRFREAAPNPACRVRSCAADERSQPSLLGQGFGSVADGPDSFGRRCLVPATTSTRPACWLRALTPRASSSIPRIPDPTPSGVGVRGSGATSWKPLRWPTGRGPRTTGPKPACWPRALQPPGASSESMDNRLESTSDGSESASAADGTKLTDERLGSTVEGRDSFGMTAPIPRMTCPAPSGEGHRLPGCDVRCRFAGGGCRLHGCALRLPGCDVRRQLAGRGLRVHG